MKQPKIRTPYTYEHSPQERNFPPSKTVPDMSMTIRELFIRHTQGKPLDVRHNDYFHHGDVYYPDPRTLDMAEIDDYIERNREYITELEQQRKQQIAEKEKLRKEVQDYKREKLSKLRDKKTTNSDEPDMDAHERSGVQDVSVK